MPPPLNRRHFLHASAAGASALALGATALTAPAHGAAAGRPPRTPYAAASFGKLPLGSVTPRGWLAGRLRTLLGGLFGRYDRISHFLDFDGSGWVHPDRAGWEEVTYWLRGYVPLAALTGDAEAQATARRWIDAILATGQPDGFFGPARLRTALNGGPDFWPYLPLLQALRSHEEFTGDERIVPFVLDFLRFMNAQGKGAFDSSWVSKRWGDGIDIAYWTHARTGEDFLLELTDKMHEWGGNWVDNFPDLHNVNVAQGFREPAQYALRAGGEALTGATYRGYERIMAAYGQFPGGGFAGDENARPGFGDPRQGFETCGIVEFMASHELLTRITGDPLWADRCEELAFNLLPAATDPDGRGVHYVTSANSVDLDDVPKNDGQFQNGFAMQSFQPGVDQYRCCPHNYGMGWPYFTEELWLTTPDGGLAASMYAPCEVRTRVRGTEVTISEETGYPFTETVTLRVTTGKRVPFTLRLRVPGWCDAPEITVNGKPVAAAPGPGFARVKRSWASGDTVVLRLPQRTSVRVWDAGGGAVSVDRGPLTYSLRIGESYERTGGTDAFPHLAVHATTPWNCALSPDAPEGLEFHRDDDPPAGDPFTHEHTPVRITAPARRLPEWVADRQRVVAPLQQSPARSTAAPETVTLIPMGAARLRITAFPTAGPDGTPWTPEPPYHRVQNKHSGKVLAVDRMSLANGARVHQFDNSGTSDHAWQLLERGDGLLLIRNGHSGKVLGVDGMSTENSAPVVQYEDNGTPDHLWRIVADADGWFRIRNEHSGKVLGVDGMSTENSAQVVQFDDNGTADHLWRLVAAPD
ncbi:RICIN domain-containing protein [Streptomyces sp. MAR4 CNX-425]|uniref:RICIN domain-containing protein n=1 Tax=Streptomyces sp. MAR4 CNX-425 TaxID=3406343 RepID=UPI003B509DE0